MAASGAGKGGGETELEYEDSVELFGWVKKKVSVRSSRRAGDTAC